MRVTIVGCGNVGLAVANCVASRSLAAELVMYDANKTKLHGDVLDFQHASSFFSTRIIEGTCWEDTAETDICVITAGARQRPGESRLDLLGRNKAIIESVVKDFVKHSPNAIILLVSNPVDVLTHFAKKAAGLAEGRVFGSGCSLDTSRLRFLLAKELQVATRNVHAKILGEHGNSSVACFSSGFVNGHHIEELIEKKRLNEIHQSVINSANEIISLKGFTDVGIGHTVAYIINAISKDTRELLPLSVCATGHYGITEDICLSLPVIIGKGGIEKVVKIPLSPEEEKAIQDCAKTLSATTLSFAEAARPLADASAKVALNLSDLSIESKSAEEISRLSCSGA